MPDHPYSEDYYLNGPASGLSNYENYHWMPDRTLPMALQLKWMLGIRSDSVVLNRTAGHKFDSAWRICTVDKVGDLMQHPEKYQMPDNLCAGCVFSDAVDLINDVVNGAETPLPEGEIDHVNFV